MPNSAAQPVVESQTYRPATLAGSRSRVVALCPPSFSIESAWDYKEAAAELGCLLSVYRTAEEFRLSDILSDLRDERVPVTHLLIILGQFNSFDDSVLLEAERVKVPRVIMYALHSVEPLERHQRRIESGLVNMLIVSTPAEEARMKSRWRNVAIHTAEYGSGHAHDVLRTMMTLGLRPGAAAL